ncbi:MAG: AmmeMemoRadiSam system protein A [Eubacteriaceae bacterium]|nr:AmmeMemoRadiSam system protein A [Eubacteriaceae bacterium]
MLYGCLVPHPPLIIEEVGGPDEIPATRAAYKKIALEAKQASPDVLVIFSPHSIIYSDYLHISPGRQAHGNFGLYNAPQAKYSVGYDSELAALIGEIAEENGIRAGFLGEVDKALDHASMVPLHFIKHDKIVRIGLSGFSLIDHYRFGMCVRLAIEKLGRNAVIVASGDMSHKLSETGSYGLAPEGALHDRYVMECLQEGDFKKLMAIDPAVANAAAECGLRSLVMLAGVFDGLDFESEVYSYEAPYGVGYLTASIRSVGMRDSLLADIVSDYESRLEATRSSEDAYVRLARMNVENFVLYGEPAVLPERLPPEMAEEQAGVFVSIYKNGELRGCIGTIYPTCPSIAEEIIQNSISSCSKDSRFDPVEHSELDELVYSVDVLSTPEPVSEMSVLNAKKYGIIVSSGSRRGLLLPNLSGVDTVKEQISIALRKGGISQSEPYLIERFEVVRHS